MNPKSAIFHEFVDLEKRTKREHDAGSKKTVRRFQVAMYFIAIMNKGDSVDNVYHDFADIPPFENPFMTIFSLIICLVSVFLYILCQSELTILHVNGIAW